MLRASILLVMCVSGAESMGTGTTMMGSSTGGGSSSSHSNINTLIFECLSKTENPTNPTRKQVADCETEAKSKYDGGGNFEREQQKQQKEKVSNSMETCVKNKVGASATPAQYRTAQKECDAAALDDFKKNGGDSEQFQLAKMEGATTKATDSFGSCIAALGLEQGTRPTPAQTTACDNEAKKAFQEAGGDVDIFQQQKTKGATKKVGSAMEECIGGLGLADGQQPDATQMATCETSAQQAFEQAGGNAAKFERAKREGQEMVLGDSLQTCVSAAVKSNTNPTPADYEQAANNCNANALKDFQKAGGDAAEFQVAKMEASRDKVRDAHIACINGLGLDGVKPTKDQLNTCDEKAKKAFQEAGGDETIFQLEKQKSMLEELATKLESCVDALGLEANVQPTNDQLATCAGEAQAVFEEMGGSAIEFQAAQKDGQEIILGDSMMACVKKQLDGISNPSRAQFKAAQRSCNDAALQDFEKAGGKPAEFELAKQDAARDKVGDAKIACVRALGLADGVKPSQTQLRSCDQGAKTVFLEAGGSQESFRRKAVEATAITTADTVSACIKGLNLADGVKPTASQKSTCEAEAKKVFQETAGGEDAEFAVIVLEGASSLATQAYKACIEAAGTTPTASQITDCDGKAMEAFEDAGGDQSVFQRAQENAARGEMFADLETCMDAAILALKLADGTDPDDSQISTALSSCDAQAQAAFVKSGGDGAQFEAEKQKGVADLIGKELEACLQVEGQVDSSCEDKAKELVEKMGGKKERFDRLKQDGVRAETAELLEACISNAGTDATVIAGCNTAAKTKFKELTGISDDSRFEKEKRRGAGEMAGASLKACMKDAADAAAKDGCEAAAKNTHKNAGGDTQDFWYDSKTGLQADALAKYTACQDAGSDDATCTAQAKTFYTDTLKGNAADWNGDDFETAKSLKDQETTIEPSAKVDMRFKLTPDAGAGLDKNALTAKKAAIATSLKTASGASKVDCSDGTDAGTKLAIVCRATAASVSDATTIQDKARADTTYATAVTSAITVSRRKLGERRLTIGSETDASRVMDTTAPGSPTKAPTKAPTNGGGSGSGSGGLATGGGVDGAYAGNFAVGSAPGLITWMMISLTMAFQLRT